MYRGPDCISQVYGTRLKPLHDDPLTSRLYASGRGFGTPDNVPVHQPRTRSLLRRESTCSTLQTCSGTLQNRESMCSTIHHSSAHRESTCSSLSSKSLNSSSMQDSCMIDKLKLEIQRLQKTLSDKEDLVLASRRIAVDKERKLKQELSDVSEKYQEVCQEKKTLEDEIKSLQDNTISRDEHTKLLTQYTKTEGLVFELQSKLVNCAATVPLDEYRMLQRELEESTDEVLQYKNIAEKKEKELEAVILSQSDRMQALKEELAKKLSEGQQMSKKEIDERDIKLRLLKEQITSALDEKSIARQEQLKELSRELEHTTQENRLLHKRIQDMSFKIQHCDSCVKLKTQLKTIQDGKRMVDINILKPIKEKGKMK